MEQPNLARADRRAPRPHGAATRLHILEMAGRLFAEHGAATTSKQVCTAAQVNLAAVNYHFGHRAGLYAAVLLEAHHRLLSLEALNAIAAGAGDARAKLGQVIDGLLDGIGQDGWPLRVFVRELLSPSPALAPLLRAEVCPKLLILKRVLAEAAGLAPDDARLPRCLLSCFAPCMLLLLADPTLLRCTLAGLRQDPPDLARHLKTFAFAGLDAVASSS